VIVCESETFTVDSSWQHSEPSRVAAGASLASTLDDIQREAILRTLQSCDWVIGGPKGAAAILGLKRTTLQARMQKLGITLLRASGMLLTERARRSPQQEEQPCALL
jgi:transcriptional regulator with GAF, ATPase, and Fis domain